MERANKSRARFHVAAVYKRAGRTWQFSELPVGEVEELTSDKDLPTDGQAIKIFEEAWGKLRPDFAVNSIAVLGKPEFHRSEARHWITYRLAVEARDRPGQPRSLQEGSQMRAQ